MKLNKLPLQKELHKLLDYNPETGVFVWKSRFGGGHNGRWNGKFSGKIAGTINKKGIIICVNCKYFSAHRLAWVYVNGNVLDNKTLIDHKNCNPHDNRIDNLRPAKHGQNSANSRILKNKILPKGVSYQKSKNTFRCRIGTGKEVVYLGTYNTTEEAAYWYDYAAKYYHGEFARSA